MAQYPAIAPKEEEDSNVYSVDWGAPDSAAAAPPSDIYGVDWGDKPEPSEENGFFDNILDLSKESYTQAKANLSSYLLTGQWENLSDEHRQGLAEAMAVANEYHDKPIELERYQTKVGQEAQDIGDAWSKGNYVDAGIEALDFLGETLYEGITNPKGFAYMSAEQAANIAATWAPAWGMGKIGAAGGAVVGSAVPAVGTAAGAAVGGAGGFVLGAGAGSFLIETGAQIREFIQGQGGDPTDPNQIMLALNKPALREDMLDRASKKGLSIAAFDAVANLLGVKLLKGAKGPISTATRGTLAMGAQVGGAGGGEVLGQHLATGTINWPDVGLEVALEMGPGGIGDIALATNAARVEANKPSPTKPDPNKPDQTPALFNPTHTVNGEPVQQVTKRGELVPNTYVNQAGDIVRTQSAESLTGQPVDISLDVDAVAEQMKAEVGAATNAYNLPETIDMPTGLVAGQMGDASQLFTDMQEPNLGEEIQYEAVDDGTMDSQDASQLFTDVMGEDISYAEDRAIAAATAAENPVNVLPEPTEAQKAAGNYKKAHTKVQGFDVSVENPVGSERKGTDKDGNPWSRTMTDDYGYLKRTIGADSDPNAAPHQIEQVDTFVKHDADIPADNPVYIIDQAKEDGSFDETKVMMGYSSAEEASERYNANYAEGWAGLKNITEATPEQLRAWLKDPAANDEYAEYLKGTPKRLQPAASEAEENAQFFADRVKAVKDAASQVEMPDKVKDADTMVSLVRDYAKATDEAGWELVDALDDASIKEVIGPARRWDGSVKGYGPFYAIENVGRWVETLGQSKAMRDQAIADGTAPNDVAVNIENVEDITKAPLDAKDMLARREDKQQYVYHATRKSKADKIKQGGLKPLQTSNWKKQGQSDTERYNEDGGVFAFESAEDAAKWAFKMNYEFKDAVSIIKAKRDGSWEVDPSEDIMLQMGKGKSLKRVGAVPASDIVSSTDLDFETSAADRGMTGAEYITKVAAELEADAPVAPASVADAPLDPKDMLARREDLPKAMQKVYDDPRVREIIDERGEGGIFDNGGNGYWVYLNDGYVTGEGDSTSIHEANIKDVMAELKLVQKGTVEDVSQEAPSDMDAAFRDLGLDDFVARREDSDPYAKMRGVEYSYQVQVESTGEIHTVTVNARDQMIELDERIAALEELQRCI